jgi:hypothetical protein
VDARYHAASGWDERVWRLVHGTSPEIYEMS